MLYKIEYFVNRELLRAIIECHFELPVFVYLQCICPSIIVPTGQRSSPSVEGNCPVPPWRGRPRAEGPGGAVMGGVHGHWKGSVMMVVYNVPLPMQLQLCKCVYFREKGSPVQF